MLKKYDISADPSGRALAGIVGSNPTVGMDVRLLYSVRVVT
jgi:hypothetical protein